MCDDLKRQHDIVVDALLQAHQRTCDRLNEAHADRKDHKEAIARIVATNGQLGKTIAKLRQQLAEKGD